MTRLLSIKKEFFKKSIPLFLMVILLVSFVSDGNIGKLLPNEELKTIGGSKVQLSSITKPAIISFWSTTCIPCIKELNAINSKYDSWKKEHKLEVYAISTDDARFASRIPAIVNKKQWKFPVYSDQEKKVFKALNIVNNPYTIVVNSTGRIVYEHASYKEGDEDELIRIIKGL